MGQDKTRQDRTGQDLCSQSIPSGIVETRKEAANESTSSEIDYVLTSMASLFACLRCLLLKYVITERRLFFFFL